MIKYFALILFAFNLGISFTQEKKDFPRLILKFEFEDNIKGNNSIVADSSMDKSEVKWGKIMNIEGRTVMAKDGIPWKSEHKVEGKKGYCYFFGGDKEKRYIRIPYSEEIEIDQDDFSISFWIKTINEGGYIIIKTTTSPYWLLCLDKGKPKFLLRDAISNQTSVVHAKSSINDGNWHHVVFVANRNSDGIFYIDGKIDGKNSISLNKGGLKKEAYIGIGGYGYVTGYFEGFLDNLRIYRGALSEKDIISLFNEGT